MKVYPCICIDTKILKQSDFVKHLLFVRADLLYKVGNKTPCTKYLKKVQPFKIKEDYECQNMINRNENGQYCFIYNPQNSI